MQKLQLQEETLHQGLSEYSDSRQIDTASIAGECLDIQIQFS